MRQDAAHWRLARRAVAERRAQLAAAPFQAPAERLARTEEVVRAAERLTASASAEAPAGSAEPALSSAGKC
jgi:hypothetical protein